MTAADARSVGLRRSSLLGDERGMVLVLALGLMLALTIGLAAVLELSASGARSATRSNADQKAYALAEAGVNGAAAALAQVASPYTWTPPATTQAGAADVVYEGGKVRWWATCSTYSGANCVQWKLSAMATVTNPTGAPATAVQRTVSIKEKVVSTPGSTAWNYFYSGDDAEVSGNGFLDEAIYTVGDLRLTGGTSVSLAAASVNVGGNLTLTGGGWVGAPTTTLGGALSSSATIVPVASTSGFPSTGVIRIDDEVIRYDAVTATGFGTVAKPARRAYGKTTAVAHGSGAAIEGRIAEVNVTGTCTGGACNTTNHIWGLSQSTTLRPITVTQANGSIASWYANAKPGPMSPCTAAASTGTLPVFDNATEYPATTKLDHGSLGVFNLTGADYDCKVVVGGVTVGEIGYNTTTHVLTVVGTVFFDRDLTTTNALIYSTPQSPGATIWTSGSFLMKKNFCAAGTYTTCNFTSWDPVAGPQLAVIASKPPPAATYTTGNDMTIQGGNDAQGLFYTDGDFTSSGAGLTQGSVVAPSSTATLTLTGGPGVPSPGFFELPGGVPNPATVTYEEGSFSG